jgi:hypothetical protein
MLMACGWDKGSTTQAGMLDIVSIPNPEPLNSDTTKGYI